MIGSVLLKQGPLRTAKGAKEPPEAGMPPAASKRHEGVGFRRNLLEEPLS
jgi:hypothetical protein